MYNSFASIYSYATIQVLASNKLISMTLEEIKRKEEMRKVLSGDYEDYSNCDIDNI